MMNDLKVLLQERGLLYQFTDEQLFEKYSQGGQSFYLGIDPSADSLQLGNLCAIMTAVHLMSFGNKCYFLIGGATGMIGDPSGRDAERNFLGMETLRNNEQSIYSQVDTFLKRLKNEYGLKFDYEMVNNYDFYKDMSVLDFWAQVGKYITVNSMIAKDSIKKRLTDEDKSITYTEFSYMLIQGYDFVKLCQQSNVYLQIGGSDQWGNITTGIEIARKKLDRQVFGLTIPIITDSTGKKFGKSEGNAIWLSAQKNSPYFVYQYFLNTNDDDVEKFLKILTLYSFEDIDAIIEKHKSDTAQRYGQKMLAKYIVGLIFGQDAVSTAEKISEVLFGRGDKMNLLANMTVADFEALGREIGKYEVDSIPKEGLGILDICSALKLTTSNTEARKMIEAGAIFCNEKKVEDIQYKIFSQNFINGGVLLRKGKKNFKLLIMKE